MAEQYANFATTTLDGAINNSTTTVVVDDGSVFPATGNFRIVIDVEIMVCTARSSNTLTVVRGQEGTTGASHSDGVAVKSPLTNESIHKLIEDNILRGTAASRPSASQAGRLYFPTDEPVILRDNGSLWQPYGPAWALKNPNDHSWSWGNQGAATLVTREFTQTMLYTCVGATGLLARMKAVPTAPYKITALFTVGYNGVEYQNPCLGMRNSSDNKEKWVRAWLRPGFQPTFYASLASSWGSSGSSNAANIDFPVFAPCYWLQIEDDNTNHYFRYSLDGLNYLTVLSHARATHMSVPDYVFWGTEADGTGGNTKRVNLLSWLEE